MHFIAIFSVLGLTATVFAANSRFSKYYTDSIGLP